MVIGINPKSASVDVRERFSIEATRQTDALTALARGEGISEVMVLSGGERTDFVLWCCDPSAASGAVLNFLTREYGLQLSEWKHFYRKLDEAAVAHVLLEAAGLDGLVRDKGTCEHFKEASATALHAGTLGRFLDSVVQRSLGMSRALADEATRYGLEAAETMARREAKTLYCRLLRDRVTPTIVALRKRLDELCLKELESFYDGLTSLSAEERELVESFAARLTQRIAGTLVHELKEPCEKIEQERLTSAVQRLFSLHTEEQGAAVHSHH